jgi:hypothetical protein
MTDNKAEIIKLILENDNAEEAVRTVANIISYFSTQHGLLQEQVVADPQIMYQTMKGML